MYFASKSNVARHKKDAHGQRIYKKTRPLQILQTRAEEVLCCVDVEGHIDVLWLDKDTVEGTESFYQIVDEPDVCVIDNIPQWARSPWTV